MRSTVIHIKELENKQYQAFTQLPPLQTANILITLALNFIRLDEKNKLLALQKNNIINPHTGQKFE